ncbi:methyltransferase domain-containing protein [Acetobacterium wieringae]|uniref:Methyltransferase domain-containing protein n=1 Tax=Acetobacterium wieringae TaxID=52694 RepID=A0A5D0WQ61_9FIRM|nr:methyltransferase domain-containing protein [Acetobacterium wieringae]
MLRKKEWNESYQHKDNFVFYPHEEVIRFVSKYVKKRIGFSNFQLIGEAGKCLDLGCGIGRHLIYLDEMQMEPFGIDLSDYAINYAKEWFRDVDKVHLIDRLTVGSVDALPYGDDYFDFVISHGVLDSMEFKTAIDGIREVNRVLKNDGYFYFDVVSGDDFEHYREYAGEDLVKGVHEKNTIQSYFNYEKIKVLLGDDFEIQECVLIQRESVISRVKNSRYHVTVKKRSK